MRRSTDPTRTLASSLATLGLCLLAAPGVLAGDVVINNGLTSSDPANRIDHSAFEGDRVYVRNVDCPPDWPSGFPGAPCPSPGAPTQVEIAEGGLIGDLDVRDFSSVDMTGGNVRWGGAAARDSSTFTMTGGTIGHPSIEVSLSSSGSASVFLSGGTHYGSLSASGSSHLVLDGGRVSSEYASVDARGESVVELLSGSIGYYEPSGRAYDSSTVIQGPTGPYLADWDLFDTSTAMLARGGADYINAADASTLDLSTDYSCWYCQHRIGGSATATLRGEGSIGQVNVSGELLVEGSEAGVFAKGSAYVRIRGAKSDPGWGFDLGSRQAATIEIPGTDFQLDGIPLPYGDIPMRDNARLSGTLVSGDALVARIGGITGSVVLVPASVDTGEKILIDNGLTPSDPSNRIDDSSHANDQIYVRNVGCPFAWPSGYVGGECPEPGAVTSVEIADGGEAAFVFSHDSSSVEMTGGTVHWGVRARDASSFDMSGGSVGSADASVSIYASGSASAALTGGTLWGSVSALDSAHLLIDGAALMDADMTFDVHDSAALEIDGLPEVLAGARGFASGSSTLAQRSEGPAAWDFSGATTATLSGGALDAIDARDEATLLLSGASVHALTLEGAATAMLAGGATDVIDARGEATLALSGASVHSLTLEGTASARMIDGAVARWTIGPAASAAMSGGAIEETAAVAGELAISGGVVGPSAVLSAEGEGALFLRGGSISDVVLEARDASRIEIVGGDFAIDGVPVQFGALPATAQERTLTGTLDSGDPILARYLLGTGAFTGTIVLQPGPDYQPRIDIKPGNDDNTFNLGLEGAINVAILSSFYFDALEVDPATIDLSGAGVNLVGSSAQEKCFAKDVDNDGFDDLVCRVDTFGMMIDPGESVAVLEAQTFDGIWIRCQDSVRIVP